MPESCPATPEFASWVQDMESDDHAVAARAVALLNASERMGNLQTFDEFGGEIDCTVSCLDCEGVVGISTSRERGVPTTIMIAGTCLKLNP